MPVVSPPVIIDVAGIRDQAEKLAEVLAEENIFYKGQTARNLQIEHHEFITQIVDYADNPNRSDRLEIKHNNTTICIKVEMEDVLHDGDKIYMTPMITEIFATDELDLGILNYEYITERLSYAIDIDPPE